MSADKPANEMTLDELLRALPEGFRAHVAPDGSIVVDESAPAPWPKEVAAAWASAQLRARTARRLGRREVLRAEGKKDPEIGRIIANEEGLAAAFPPSTVKGWGRTEARQKP